MECQEVRKAISAWMDQELPPDQAVRIARHIEGCNACMAESKALKQLMNRLDAMPPVQVPSSLARNTLRKFKQDFGSPGIIDWWRSLGLVMRGASCAAVTAGLLLGLGLATSLTYWQTTGATIRLIDVIYYTGGILS